MVRFYLVYSLRCLIRLWTCGAFTTFHVSMLACASPAATPQVRRAGCGCLGGRGMCRGLDVKLRHLAGYRRCRLKDPAARCSFLGARCMALSDRSKKCASLRRAANSRNPSIVKLFVKITTMLSKKKY